MTRSEIVNKIGQREVTAEDVVKAIRASIVTFEELQNTENFPRDKQKRVREILASYEAEENAFKSADTLSKLEDFLKTYPNSVYTEEVYNKIRLKKQEQEGERIRKLEEAKKNINKYAPDELIENLGEEFLRELCQSLDIDYEIVVDYEEPKLILNARPESVADIPLGYTDVFFWGIPTSGKTCALATIFYTIKKKYTIENPKIETKFGTTYRHSLTNEVFKNGIGHLPERTVNVDTQYMPFLLRKRNEQHSRKISFFELSGELFWHFYEIVHGRKISTDAARATFDALKLVLDSKNQKIHFFFIDYNQETKGSKDRHGLTQEDYLDAAATYFRDKDDIFKKKTDAVYVIVTKSDEIKSGNKTQAAKQFLEDNFGSFMDIIKRRRKDNVKVDVKIFSIGDVYFKRICKMNSEYAEDIIEELLNTIKPYKEDSWLTKILKR